MKSQKRSFAPDRLQNMDRKLKGKGYIKPAQWGVGLTILCVCVCVTSLVLTKSGVLGADSPVAQSVQNRALLMAVLQGDTPGVQSALHDGADPNSTLPYNDGGFLPRLRQRGQMLVNPAQSERLHRSLAYTPDSALTLAVRNCDTKITRLLLEAGASPDTRRGYGETPLVTLAFVAGRQKQTDACTDTARGLLKYKADPNASDEEGHTPLGAALLASAPVSLVRCLLEAGADPKPARALLWDGANPQIRNLLAG